MKTTIVLLLTVFTTLAGLAQETYTLSAESTLVIDGTSTLRDWSVTANTMMGKLKAETDMPKEITFEVPVADIKSERGSTMDKKTFNALKGGQHPKVTFALKEFKDNNAASGTLNIAGVEKDVEVSTKMTDADGKLTISGEHTITLQDYNMVPPSAMFGQIVVGDDVIVKFNLVFTK
ncbi:MAG: YceI family protein [Bacteroidota bacterium]